MARKPDPKPEHVDRLTLQEIATKYGLSLPDIEFAAKEDPRFPIPSADGYEPSAVHRYMIHLYADYAKSVGRMQESIRQIEAEPAPAAPQVPATRYLTLRIPIGTPENHGFVRNSMGHVECTLHRQRELPGLRMMLAGLVEVQAKDYQGRPISNQRNVLQWLCREVMAQVEAQLKAPATESTSAA